jgi:hypothetical protein
LDDPTALAVSGTTLYVESEGFDPGNDDATIGEYTTSGGTVNASLLTGLDTPAGIAADGANLFVTDFQDGLVAEYDSSGATINADLISGFSTPYGPVDIAAFDGDLFVADSENLGTDGTIGEYTESCAVVDASLVTGLNQVSAIGVVPEPSSAVLLAIGGVSLLSRRRRAQ